MKTFAHPGHSSPKSACSEPQAPFRKVIVYVINTMQYKYNPNHKYIIINYNIRKILIYNIHTMTFLNGAFVSRQILRALFGLPMSRHGRPRGIFVMIARDFQIISKLLFSTVFVWVDFYTEM